MNRVLLINKTKFPTRQELVTSERTMGELFFANFNLNWAGYIGLAAEGCLCANWIIPDSQVTEFHNFARTHTFKDYELAVLAPGMTLHGGQGEVRVI